MTDAKLELEIKDAKITPNRLHWDASVAIISSLSALYTFKDGAIAIIIAAAGVLETADEGHQISSKQLEELLLAERKKFSYCVDKI